MSVENEQTPETQDGLEYAIPVEPEPKAEPEPKEPEEGAEAAGETDTQDPEKQADSDKDTDDEADDEPKAKPSKAEKKLLRRIDRLTRHRREAERRVAELEAKNADKPAEAKADAKPKAEDFDSYDAFVDALTDWKLEQRTQQSKPDEDMPAPQMSPEETASIKEFYEEGTDAYEDFAEVVGNPKLQISTQMATLFMESDNGPDIAYYLGQHPDESAKIAELDNPVQIARALGRIEAKLEQREEKAETPEAPAKPSKASSKAPEPIEPIDGAGKTGDGSLEDMSFSEYEKRRVKQLRDSGQL